MTDQPVAPPPGVAAYAKFLRDAAQVQAEYLATGLPTAEEEVGQTRQSTYDDAPDGAPLAPATGGEKKTSGPAISYLTIYPALRDAARTCGYSLALHGSLNRDMDLIAIPWTDNAVLPEDLIEALRAATSLYFVEGWSGPHTLPAGRIGYKLTPGGAEYIDISVLSPFVSIARARAEGEAKGRREERERCAKVICPGCAEGLAVEFDAKYPSIPMHRYPVAGMEGRTLTSACKARRLAALAEGGGE